jgi:hypothetical protein
MLLHLATLLGRVSSDALSAHAASVAVAQPTEYLAAVHTLRRALTRFLEEDPVAGAEAGSWLRDAAARAGGTSERAAAALLGALRRRGARSRLGVACLALLLERRPAELVCLLRADAALWQRFFSLADHQGDHSGCARACAWFGSWSPDGHHGPGAAALARYALAHRHSAWHLLAWTGRHAQSPVVAACKPATWCELDTRATLQALMQHGGGVNPGPGTPSFWASPELWDSLRSGAVMTLDRPFFADALARLLDFGADAERRQLWQLLESALAAEPLNALAQRLLPTLQGGELLDALRCGFAPAEEVVLGAHAAVAAAPLAHVTWRRLEEAELAAALARRGGGGLLTLLQERAATAAHGSAASAACHALHAARAVDVSAVDDAHAQLMRSVAEGASPERGRLTLLVHAWLLRLRLAGADVEQLEGAMRAEGVSYRREEQLAGEPEDGELRGRKRRTKRRHRSRSHSRSRSRSRHDAPRGERAAWDAREAGEEGAFPAAWRTSLDGFALSLDQTALRDALADAAADAWLRAVQAMRAGR